MSAEKEERRTVTRVEVLPPTTPSVALPPNVRNLPQGLFGMPLMARVRYASEQKQIEAYQRLVAAKNGLLRSLQEQQGLVEGFAGSAERARHLDDIREAARLDVKTELARARQRHADSLNDAETRQLQGEVGKTRLQIELLQLQRERERLENPAAHADPARQTVAERFESMRKEVEEIEAAHAALYAKMVAEAGGEENLSAVDRHRLEQFGMMRERFVSSVMEALL